MKSHRNDLVTSVDRAIEEKIATRLDGTPLDVRYQGSILLGTQRARFPGGAPDGRGPLTGSAYHGGNTIL